jgi:hypothetical protein
MDPNVICRNVVAGTEEIFRTKTIRRIYVRSLTEKTHGNAHGVGLADFVSKKLVGQIDWTVTGANGLTAGTIELDRLPLVVGDDEQTIRIAVETARLVPLKEARIVWIKNTLDLEEMAVSQSLAGDVRCNADLAILESPCDPFVVR